MFHYTGAFIQHWERQRDSERKRKRKKETHTYRQRHRDRQRQTYRADSLAKLLAFAKVPLQTGQMLHWQAFGNCTAEEPQSRPHKIYTVVQ